MIQEHYISQVETSSRAIVDAMSFDLRQYHNAAVVVNVSAYEMGQSRNDYLGVFEVRRQYLWKDGLHIAASYTCVYSDLYSTFKEAYVNLVLIGNQVKHRVCSASTQPVRWVTFATVTHLSVMTGDELISKALRPYKHTPTIPQECPCGINRTVCEYHR